MTSQIHTSQTTSRTYSDLSLIGRGGFASVYRAIDDVDTSPVAIKVLERSGTPAEHLARFERERQALSSMSVHPNVVSYLDWGSCADGRLFLVTELLDGGSLADEIDKGPMSWQAVTELGIGLAGAIETAHLAGLMHRDVKPANILRSSATEAWHLIDFGVALFEGSHHTATGELVASLAYAAPETFDGGHQRESRDAYGLAATLAALLSANEQFCPGAGESVLATMLRIATEPVEDLRRVGVPPCLAAVLETALAKDPGDRYPSALDFANALGDVRSQLGAPHVAIPICSIEPLGSPAAAAVTKLMVSSPDTAPATSTETRHTALSGWRTNRRLASIAAAFAIVAGAFGSISVVNQSAPATAVAIVDVEAVMAPTPDPTAASSAAETALEEPPTKQTQAIAGEGPAGGQDGGTNGAGGQGGRPAPGPGNP